jgi:aryl-phospho-beta-D-glucosidase BglC (GH1 family)
MRTQTLITLLLLSCTLSFCRKDDAMNPSDTTQLSPEELEELPKNAHFRGFNLLDKFDVDWSNAGFKEKDFQLISELGFNFVRLPIDYRTYIEPNDWLKFDESKLANIDQAIEWGKKYQVHVQLNLHRAPGYGVNQPSKPLPVQQQYSLWTDKQAQDAFLAHWTFFAKRYKKISAKILSFNLVNEPNGVSTAEYAKVMKPVIAAIKAISPRRAVYLDGTNYATEPVTELAGLEVRQALHNYAPFALTHFGASWVQGANNWELPNWPTYDVSQYLYGSTKPELKSPMSIEGDFAAGTQLVFKVAQVSWKALLQVKLDGVLLYEHLYEPGEGVGEWSTVIKNQYGYQNLYNREYTVNLPKAGRKLSIEIMEGDWMRLSALTLGGKVFFLGNDAWGQRQSPLNWNTSNGSLSFPDGRNPLAGAGALAKWHDFGSVSQTPVMVGEFGVYNNTPHDTALRYLEDVLKLYQGHKLGWALWEFKGSFGVFNSGRKDVQYEDYQGYKLDRKMLELLQRY